MVRLIRQRYAAFETRVLCRMTEAERRAVLELDAALKRNAWRLAGVALGFVALLGLGLYLFGDGKLSIPESLGVAAMLLVAVGFVVVAAWTRPARLTGHTVRRILAMVVLASLGGLVGAYLAEPAGWSVFVHKMERIGPLVVFSAAVTGLLIALLAIGLAMLRQRETAAIEARLRVEADARLREEQLAHTVAEARLAALQAQVEPHFLFNALGAVVELAERGSPDAARLCRHLVDFLRGSHAALRAGATTVGAELVLVRDYLAVMAIRLGPRFTWTVDATAALLDRPLPPTMLLTLVENAIKHGIEPSAGPASIAVSVREDDATLAIVVADTGRGLDAGAQATGGFGLANLRERLALQFGDRATLTLAANAPRGARAVLHLPIVAAAA